MACAALAAAMLSGCSFALPSAISSTAPAKGMSEDVTGTVSKSPPVLSRAFDAEDIRRASAALGTALDPQGSGASVNWDNPTSGAKGSFTPVGQPYPLEGRICRAFLAEVATRNAAEKLQGAACREKTAEWTLTDVRPFRKG